MSNFFSPNSSFDHSSQSQKTRQNSALKLEVVKLDIDNCVGIINDYEVSLEKCSCRDFILQKSPCKHMYRLAHELGFFVLAGNICNVNERKERTLIKTEVNSLSNDVLYELNDLLYLYIFRNKSSFVSVSNPNIDFLITNSFAKEIESLPDLSKCFRKDFLVKTLKEENAKIKFSSSKLILLEHLKINYPNTYNKISSHIKILTIHERLLPHANAIYKLIRPKVINSEL